MSYRLESFNPAKVKQGDKLCFSDGMAVEYVVSDKWGTVVCLMPDGMIILPDSTKLFIKKPLFPVPVVSFFMESA